MILPASVRALALAFDEAVETPHFENTAFKVRKKIFATMNVKENRVCVKLPAVEQSVFCSFDKTVVYPVPNAWGRHGWTLINLKKVRKSMLIDTLTTAYCHCAPEKLAAKYKTGEL